VATCPLFGGSAYLSVVLERRRETGGADVQLLKDGPADEGHHQAAAIPAAQAPGSRPAPSFGDRYACYLPQVYRYLCVRCGNADEAADLAQQVFVQALTARHPYREGSVPFAAWLFRIARNLAIDAQRRRRPQVAWELVPDAMQPRAPDDPEQAVLRQEAAIRLRSLLLQLDPAKRELLALRFAGGLTCREIGLILGKSEGAIKKQLTRTISAVKEHYDADEG
jgi:RNA polymerase sigma-70 factor, ECF subfamily